MHVTKRRDRVLIFRLTQDEYQYLVDASHERGARNLSEFAREQLLGKDGPVQGRLALVERRLDDLQGHVKRVEQLICRIEPAPEKVTT